MFGHGIDVKLRHASTAVATAALALAAATPSALAQVPEVELPPVPNIAAQAGQIVQTPPTSAISDQYHEIADQVADAVAPAAAPQPAAPPVAPAEPKPVPAPEYHPKADKYHSDTASDVTVTQAQPENVNVSIRINSPGDDGPVVQVNNAGGPVDIDVVDNHTPAPQAPAAPAPDAGGGGLPANWTWIWTSACFGGSGGGAPAAAAATTGWDWRWSCGAEDGPVGDIDVPGPDSFPDLVAPDVPTALAEIPLAAAGELAPAAASPAKPTARPDQRVEATMRSSPRRPPPSAPAVAIRGRPAAAAPPAAVAGPATAVAPRADRRAAAKPHARPAQAGTSNFPPGADGPSAGAATGLGAAMSLLLGGWIAVLVGALALVLKQIWLRRWSGPPRRKPVPRAMRLERPG
jgi:hypothetical protein